MLATALPPARVLVPRDLSVRPLPAKARQLVLQGTTMGTTWCTTLLATASTDARAIAAEIESVLARVVEQMSPWLSGSDVSRFNRASAGSRHKLPDEMLVVMRCALDVAGHSDGAFDPTAGPLVDAWGFGAERRFDEIGHRPPTRKILDALTVGWSRLDLDPQGWLTQPGGIELSLSAIAKGYAVDAVAQRLTALGCWHHLVEIGGELRGTGVKSAMQPWWVEIEPPAVDCSLRETRIALHACSVATSGDYRRFFAHAGKRISHTIDPRTRRPVEHAMASVAVVHTSCMWADAWATALMVAGPDDGPALAERERLAALFRWRASDGMWQETASPALRELET